EALVQPQAVRPNWKVGQIVTYSVYRGEQRLDIPIQLMNYPLGTVLSRDWPRWFGLGLLAALSSFLLISRPANRSIRVLVIWMSSFNAQTVFWSLGLLGSDLVTGSGFWMQRLTQNAALLLAVCGFMHFSLVFPSRKVFIRRNRQFILLIYVLPFVAYLLLGILAWPLSINALDWLRHWLQSYDILTLSILALAFVSLLSSYRHMVRSSSVSYGNRLVLLLLTLSGAIYFILITTHFVLPQALYGQYSINWVFITVGLVVCFAFFFAIARYRLFRIKLFVSRTLVYTLLSIIIICLYVVVVGALSQVFDVTGNFLISLVATGIIATLAPRLHQRVQRSV